MHLNERDKEKEHPYGKSNAEKTLIFHQGCSDYCVMKSKNGVSRKPHAAARMPEAFAS